MTQRAHFFAPFTHGSPLVRTPPSFRDPAPLVPPPESAELPELPPPARVPSLEEPIVHEFENARAQFPNAAVHAEAVRMGAWLALLGSGTAFAGLFAVYAVVRVLHPEVFAYGSYFMEPRTGAVATGVLLAASVTAALSARYAAAGRKVELALSAAATVALGLTFAGIGVTDGVAKAERHLLPGAEFAPLVEVWETPVFAHAHPIAAERAATFRPRKLAADGVEVAPSSTAQRDALSPLVSAGALGQNAVYPDFPSQPRNAHVFFGLYYLIAGAHLLHVLAGVLAFGFVLARTRATGAADLPGADAAALHLHFVALVWLFLYPLFYLPR